jgi:arylsulfatase B
MREGMSVTQQGIGEYATRLFTKEAMNIVTKHNTSQPLFLYLSHLAVHVGNPYEPLQAPYETIDMFAHIEDPNRRVFAAMLTELDHSVGILVQALADRSMLENSIIIFTTDNGGCAGGYEDSAASNWPLRGVKNSVSIIALTHVLSLLLKLNGILYYSSSDL